MTCSCLGFGISVLHVPWGGNHLQQLIHPSKIAPCHKYSGTLSSVVLNMACFAFTESGFFPGVMHHYFLQSPVGFVLFSALLCLLSMNLYTGRTSATTQNFSSHFQGSPNAIPRVASPETGHIPWSSLGVPLSGWASLLPSDWGLGLFQWVKLVSALCSTVDRGDWLFSYGYHKEQRGSILIEG